MTQQPKKEEPFVKFDNTINAGAILQAGVVAVALIGAFVALQVQVSTMKETVSDVDDLKLIIAQTAARQDTMEDVLRASARTGERIVQEIANLRVDIGRLQVHVEERPFREPSGPSGDSREEGGE